MKRSQHKVIISVILLFCILLSSPWAQSQVTGEDVEALADTTGQIVKEFTRATALQRWIYEYAGSFSSEEEKTKLRTLAQKAGIDLQKVYDAQQQYKKLIEDYDGPDWDRLFGRTGLWRRVRADAKRSLWGKCRVDYFLALTSQKKTRLSILKNILTASESLSPEADIIKAQTIILMVKDDKSLQSQAQKILGSILKAPDIIDEVYFNVSVSRFKLIQNISSKQLDDLSAKIADSTCADDFELNLQLAFLGCTNGYSKLLERVIKKRPDMQNFVGNVILSNLNSIFEQGKLTKELLQNKSVYEINLAVKVALAAGPKKFKELLYKLYDFQNYRSSPLYYALAQAHIEDEPAKAVEYYIAAAKAKKTSGGRLEIEKIELAEKAALLAYKLYYESSSYSQTALSAFNYYTKTAGEKIDHKISYLYAGLFYEYGDKETALELLRKISRSKGKFANRAKLDLIVHKIKNNIEENPNIFFELRKELKELIDSITIDPINCSDARQVFSILAGVIESIDRYETSLENFQSFAEDCEKLANSCLDCADPNWIDQARLIRAEIGIFTARGDKDKLAHLEKILTTQGLQTDGNNIDWLRCQARLSAARGDFRTATAIWGRISEAIKLTGPGKKQPHPWWRAKFHQLNCWSKLPDTTEADLTHAVEVLLNSFAEVPEFWAKKLSELKRGAHPIKT